MRARAETRAKRFPRAWRSRRRATSRARGVRGAVSSPDAAASRTRFSPSDETRRTAGDDARETPPEAPTEGPSDRDEPAAESPLDDLGDWMSVGTGSTTHRDDEDDSDFQSFHAAEVTLREHLDQQVALTPLSDRDRALVRFLIEALDDDGELGSDEVRA